MSDPPLSDIAFKNKMALVWTTLKYCILLDMHSLDVSKSSFSNKFSSTRWFVISGLVKMVSLVKPFKFVTNNRVERSGFSAQFKEIDEFQSACGGKAAVIAEFNSEYPKRPSALSHISSAGFPGRVPPGSECSWHITAPANNQIVHLEFISFKMAKNCKFHFVQLYSAPDCKPENLNKSNEVPFETSDFWKNRNIR